MAIQGIWTGPALTLIPSGDRAAALALEKQARIHAAYLFGTLPSGGTQFRKHRWIGQGGEVIEVFVCRTAQGERALAQIWAPGGGGTSTEFFGGFCLSLAYFQAGVLHSVGDVFIPTAIYEGTPAPIWITRKAVTDLGVPFSQKPPAPIEKGKKYPDNVITLADTKYRLNGLPITWRGWHNGKEAILSWDDGRSSRYSDGLFYRGVSPIGFCEYIRIALNGFPIKDEPYYISGADSNPFTAPLYFNHKAVRGAGIFKNFVIYISSNGAFTINIWYLDLSVGVADWALLGAHTFSPPEGTRAYPLYNPWFFHPDGLEASTWNKDNSTTLHKILFSIGADGTLEYSTESSIVQPTLPIPSWWPSGSGGITAIDYAFSGELLFLNEVGTGTDAFNNTLTTSVTDGALSELFAVCSTTKSSTTTSTYVNPGTPYEVTTTTNIDGSSIIDCDLRSEVFILHSVVGSSESIRLIDWHLNPIISNTSALTSSSSYKIKDAAPVIVAPNIAGEADTNNYSRDDFSELSHPYTKAHQLITRDKASSLIYMAYYIGAQRTSKHILIHADQTYELDELLANVYGPEITVPIGSVFIFPAGAV